VAIPNYPKPASQWLANQLAQVKATAAVSVSGGTSYVIEFPVRKPGETEPEHKRGETVGIEGNLAFDHEGNATGLSGWGQASFKTGSWVEL
jgi:hypothetical protein